MIHCHRMMLQSGTNSSSKMLSKRTPRRAPSCLGVGQHVATTVARNEVPTEALHQRPLRHASNEHVARAVAGCTPVKAAARASRR